MFLKHIQGCWERAKSCSPQNTYMQFSNARLATAPLIWTNCLQNRYKYSALIFDLQAEQQVS